MIMNSDICWGLATCGPIGHDVSEERSASIFSVKEWAKEATGRKKGSKQSLNLRFDPEDGGSTFLRHADELLPDCKASYTRRFMALLTSNPTWLRVCTPPLHTGLLLWLITLSSWRHTGHNTYSLQLWLNSVLTIIYDLVSAAAVKAVRFQFLIPVTLQQSLCEFFLLRFKPVT
jgi:hypothetical protein